MFQAFDCRTGELLGTVFCQAGETVVILNREGNYEAVGTDSVDVREVGRV